MKMMLTWLLVLGVSAFAGDRPVDSVKQEVILTGVTSFDAYQSGDGSISADFEGYLPTPCHSAPRVSVIRGGKLGQEVLVRVFSTRKTAACIEVIKSFKITAFLGFFEEGTYNVTVQPNTQWELTDVVEVE